ncbi:competence type IV pilus minor pilin ComGG [Enterococcus sp. AZ109]|uniref:competence type IV pilus minor pilin ComGG n=1 Tax=Enterococcus sp. AZ109 TaxID=2774634 RepID=UPI003F1F9EAE
MNKRGGILLSVLLIIFLFSSLILQLLFTYHQTADFSKRTIQLYQAKIAKEEFLLDYSPTEATQGIWYFDQGELQFEKDGKSIKILIIMEGKKYHFTETIKASVP